MNDINSVLKRLVAIEDELIRLRKQRNYELNNLDEDNIPKLRQYSQIISKNQAAVSLVEQKVSDVESSVTLLSQYTSFDNVVVVEASDDKTGWDKTRVYYDKTSKIYYYYDGRQWLATTSPVTAGLDTSIAQIQAKTAENEAEISLVAQSVTQNTQAITGLETLTGQIDGEIKIVKTNLASVETKADDAAASAELAAQSVTELESEVNGQIKTLTQNVASVKTTADSASASVSAIVTNIGSNGTVNAASIVAKINAAGSSVQIAADHISLKGKTIALTSDSINIESTYFDVSTAGVVSCSAIEITGDDSYIEIDGSTVDSAKIKVNYTGYPELYIEMSPGGFSARDYSDYGSIGADYLGIGNDYGFVHATGNTFGVHCDDTGTDVLYVYASPDSWSSSNQVTVNGSFVVSGYKSRVESTEHYGNRLMYAYETPAPMYADFGRGTIAEDGMCVVYLDPLFYECVDNVYEYFVFLQREGGGEIEVTERLPDRFTVTGAPGATFAWMFTAPQKGFVMTRCEEFFEPETEPPQISNPENAVYDKIGDTILKDYENQLG